MSFKQYYLQEPIAINDLIYDAALDYSLRTELYDKRWGDWHREYKTWMPHNPADSCRYAREVQFQIMDQLKIKDPTISWEDVKEVMNTFPDSIEWTEKEIARRSR